LISSISDLYAHFRIFQIPKLGTKLKQDQVPLTYTPRKFVTHPQSHLMYLVESDHRTYGESAMRDELQKQVVVRVIEHVNVTDWFQISNIAHDRAIGRRGTLEPSGGGFRATEGTRGDLGFMCQDFRSLRGGCRKGLLSFTESILYFVAR